MLKDHLKRISGTFIIFRNQVAFIVFSFLVLVFFWHAGTRFDSLIRLLSAVAWPLLVGAFIWLFRTNLGTLIDRFLGGKIAGTELKFAQIASAKAELLQAKQEGQRKPTEYKILNTLFTKQVNKWPNLDVYWVFWIPSDSPEYADYLEAKGKLLGEGLISEMNDSNRGILLTNYGFLWCKGHYGEFPPEQWWEFEQMDQEKLQKVLSGELGPKP